MALPFIMFTACEKEPDGGGNGTADRTAEYITLQKKSPKRGVSFNFGQLPDNDIPLLGPACSWSYNWGSSTSNQAFQLFEQYDMDFCPMAWNANWNENTFRQFKQLHPECEYILA